MFVEQPPMLFRMLFPGVIFRLKKEGRKVFLTFDDGPIPEVTPKVLDILDRYNVKATFFMVGENVARHPELLKEVRQRGHEAANHTMNHLQGIKCRSKEYVQNVLEANKLIGGGLFRPPHGLLTHRQLHTLKKQFKVVMSDVIVRDYSPRLSADDVVQNVKRYTRPGSVIVFHDSLKSRKRVLDALPRTLDWLQEQNYETALLGRELE